MKESLTNISFLVSFVIFTSSWSLTAQNNISGNIIAKDNGRIILAYRVFEDFLNSDKTWESYKRIVLDPYPEMQAVHNHLIIKTC